MEDIKLITQIADEQICSLAFYFDQDDRIHIVACEESNVEQIFDHGKISDLSKTAADIVRNLDALKNRLSKVLNSQYEITKSYLTYSPRSLVAENIPEKRTSTTVRKITPQFLNALKEEIYSRSSEYRDVVYALPLQYCIDGNIVDNPIDSSYCNFEAQFLEVSLTSTIATNYERLRSFVPTQIDFIPAPAAFHFALSKEEQANDCLMIDFEKKATIVSRCKDGMPVRMVVIPIGYEALSNDVSKVLQISPSLAAGLLPSMPYRYYKDVDETKKARFRVRDGIEQQEINSHSFYKVIYSRVAELCTLIKSVLVDDAAEDMLPSRCVVFGAGSTMQLLVSTVKNELNLDVVEKASTAHLLDEQSSSFATHTLTALICAAKLAKDNCVREIVVSKVDEPEPEPEVEENKQEEKKSKKDKKKGNLFQGIFNRTWDTMTKED